MLPADILTHDFTDSDFTPLSLLCRTTYPGRDISDEKYLQWEYGKNPDGNALITVAEKNSEIISQYVVLPRKFVIGRNCLMGSLSVNTLTHPSFRGKNLFPDLAGRTFEKCRRNGLQFTMGFPNGVSLPIIRKKNLFEEIGELTLLVRPLSAVKSSLKYIFGKKEKSGKEIDLFFPWAEALTEKISPLFFPQDKEAYNNFLDSFNKEKTNVTLRSPEFLVWRYFSIPKRKYHLFKRVENTSMTTFVVFRAKYIYGLRCGIVLDFCSLESSGEEEKMLSYIYQIARENKLDLLFVAFSPGSSEANLFRKNGYVRVPPQLMPQKLSVIIKKHDPVCPEDVSDFNKWFLTFGDYDIF